MVFNKEGRIRIERTAIKILAKKLLQMRADRTAYRRDLKRGNFLVLCRNKGVQGADWCLEAVNAGQIGIDHVVDLLLLIHYSDGNFEESHTRLERLDAIIYLLDGRDRNCLDVIKQSVVDFYGLA